MPATCGALMLVPDRATWNLPDELPPAFDEKIRVPGAATSGLRLPSPVGPRLELDAIAGGDAMWS